MSGKTVTAAGTPFVIVLATHGLIEAVWLGLGRPA